MKVRVGCPRRSWRLALCAVFATAASLLLLGCPSGNVGGPGSASTCLACHNGRTAEDMRLFLLSAHKNVTCDTCHVGAEAHVQSGGLGGSLINPASGPFELSYAACVACHEETVAQYTQSVHATSRLVACYDCHDTHSPSKTVGPTTNNLLCRSCHVFGGFRTDAEITAHTNHPVDPTGTGASRCTNCHMPPTVRTNQPEGPHSHTFAPIPPMASVEAATNGVSPIPPNSCAGITGCHDGTYVAPIFDVDNSAQMTGLQAVYDTWFSKAAP